MKALNSEIANRIDESIHNELHRQILKRKMIDGLTYEKLAEEFDYSVRQMKRIVYKAQDNLLIK